ncbi:hypothetical protein IAU60_003838 [Kwoniella sp. DSM 27419]
MPPPAAEPAASPAALSHFVIFNPTIRPDIPKTQDKDEDDDVREAAQILFYTSREARGVSRDKMLRQVGLAKGLMGFADMLASNSARYWAIHAHKSRLILYSPEPNFYIYVRDPTPSAQGLSNEILVDGLIRGYEDFRLLHGTLQSQLPPSSASSSLLDKYFTRFAFQYESDHFATLPLLSTWVGGFPPFSNDTNLMSPVRAEIDAEGSIFAVAPHGPLYAEVRSDQALVRFLVKLIQASLPPTASRTDDAPSIPADGRQSLGFGLSKLTIGRRSNTLRASSWTTLGGWVPEMRRTSTPTADTPDRRATPVESAKETVKEKGKWSFGLGGFAGAMGNVSTALGLPGAQKESAHPRAASTKRDEAPPSPRMSRDDASTPESTSSFRVPSHQPVEQVVPSSTDLEIAAEPDADLEWDQRWVWVDTANGLEKRRLCWIIRDNLLLAVLPPTEATSPFKLPSSGTALQLLSSLSTGTVSPGNLSINAYVSKTGTDVEKGGHLDLMTDQALRQLRAGLNAESGISEIYAKTPASTVIAAVAAGERELYLAVGKKEASLTDAEHAMRVFPKTA